MVYQNGKAIAMSLASNSEPSPAEDIYSTEETRIGTWIDGKPLYRKVYIGNVTFVKGSETQTIMEPNFRSNKHAVYTYGNIHMPYSSSNMYDYMIPIAATEVNYAIIVIIPNGDLMLVTGWDSPGRGTFEVVVMYTKNADQATIELSAMSQIKTEESSTVTVSSIPEAVSAPASSAKIL